MKGTRSGDVVFKEDARCEPACQFGELGRAMLLEDALTELGSYRQRLDLVRSWMTALSRHCH
jgi:hypothetical protein